jgi:hypothetical protein
MPVTVYTFVYIVMEIITYLLCCYLLLILFIYIYYLLCNVAVLNVSSSRIIMLKLLNG